MPTLAESAESDELPLGFSKIWQIRAVSSTMNLNCNFEKIATKARVKNGFSKNTLVDIFENLVFEDRGVGFLVNFYPGEAVERNLGVFLDSG